MKSIACSVLWCNIEANGAKGYCRTHYTQMNKYGIIRPQKKDTCSVTECKNKPKTKGFCFRHYHQYRRNGKIINTRRDTFLKQKIKIAEDTCFITIYRKNGSFEISTVDRDDYELIKKYKFYMCKKGYVRISGHKKFRYLHQLILNSTWVDHFDHNTLNNKRGNLRLCTHQQNQFNRKAVENQKVSNYKGVNRGGKNKPYSATIWKDGKRNFLGSFKTENEAALAYNTAAISMFGEFAYLNKIKEH